MLNWNIAICLFSLEAATSGVLLKKLFLKILQKSQENTYEICEILISNFFYRTPPTASVNAQHDDIVDLSVSFFELENVFAFTWKVLYVINVEEGSMWVLQISFI